ncbi:DUF6621 family protein [Bacteroides sp.]|uniref:DUF6621 family protein n=1 Tax=Bacteroides sp. TaxID=29523 RepID=UPI00263A2AB6|nr:DUF6621 family protein [Bacteroides sp.]
MEDKVEFSENVILIDVVFLNKIAYHAKKVLGERLGRELPSIDLPAWLSYLSLDAGLRGSDNEIQVILLHDEATHELDGCEPANLDGLNGMACRTSLGEFAFSCVTPAQITSCEALYLDLMNLALDSADVKRLMLVPFHPLYGDRVEDGLREFFAGKSEEQCARAVYFVMEEPLQPVLARWDLILYSLAQAFGIKSDEL